MNVFGAGKVDGGLTWLPADDLPTDATPVNLFEMDTSRLPIAGPGDVAWFGDAA